METLLTVLFWLALFIGTGLTLAYRRVPLFNATLAIGAVMLAYVLFGGAHWLWKLVLLIGYTGMVLLNFEDFRRERISRRLFRFYKQLVPEMSDTEREALEAGTVWWDGELFGGLPDWNKLLSIPAPCLSKEEKEFLDGPCEELCEMIDDWKITHELADITPEVWDYIKKKGFFAMIIPKRYGGLEFSALANSCVLVKLASRSGLVASTVGVPNSLGPAELLLKYGTEAQKDHYLPRLADGREIPCFALTSPTAGSDATSITDSGVICKGEWEGEEIVGIRLNWNKRYITLAPIATVLGLAFKLYDPDHLAGDQDAYGITAALIPTDLPGITIGRRHFPLNVPFQNGPTQGQDVFVPLDFIIGGMEMAGQGWRMLVECLSVGRAIALPSNVAGGAKTALATTGAYARIRKQFNMPIGRFEGVEEPIAHIAGYTYIMDAGRIMTAGAIDMGEEPSVPSAIMKYHNTEMGRVVGNHAMDVHGGKGIILGPKNYLGRGYELVPVGITVEGANIMTRSLIIFGQGAIRCHPWVLKELRAAENPDEEQGLRDFDESLFGHMGYAATNAARAFVLAVTHSRFTSVPVQHETRRYYQHINRFSAAFAVSADVAMLVLGGGLKKKESLSARLGDMLSFMYLASAVLKRYEDHGRPREDLPLVEWACRDLLYRLQESLHDFIRNFPNRPVATMLRLLVFPRGRGYYSPGDRREHQVASMMINPTASRARLIDGIFLKRIPSNPVGMLDEALELAVAVEPLEKRLREAVKDGVIPEGDIDGQIDAAAKNDILTATEAQRLRDYNEKVMALIEVDDFEHEELGTKPIKKKKRSTRKKKATKKEESTTAEA